MVQIKVDINVFTKIDMAVVNYQANFKSEIQHCCFFPTYVKMSTCQVYDLKLNPSFCYLKKICMQF